MCASCFCMFVVESSGAGYPTYYLKVAGSIPACGKLSFSPLFFLSIYITIAADNTPYAFLGIIVC